MGYRATDFVFLVEANLEGRRATLTMRYAFKSEHRLSQGSTENPNPSQESDTVDAPEPWSSEESVTVGEEGPLGNAGGDKSLACIAS